jgi:hypothetical protein
VVNPSSLTVGCAGTVLLPFSCLYLLLLVLNPGPPAAAAAVGGPVLLLPALLELAGASKLLLVVMLLLPPAAAAAPPSRGLGAIASSTPAVKRARVNPCGCRAVQRSLTTA